MDYFLRRERRRLIEDLNDLQHEEDLQRQYQSTMYNFKELGESRLDSDDDNNEYRNYQHRRKEDCLVKLTYRNPNTRRHKHVDEIMIIQNNRIIFKSCLQDGEQLTFKLNRYRNQSRLKLKFYINDLLEDEMIACCEYGLINRNRNYYFFQIENIIGAKPCYHCESDDKTSKTSSSTSKKNPSTKIKTPPTISRSSSVLSEDQSYEQKLKEKKSTLETHNNKASSEGFSADITEFSDHHTSSHNPFNNEHQSDEDSTDVLPDIRETPSKPTYGPPQLSTMSSITESFDLPSPNIRESTFENLFDSSSNTQERTISRSNSNIPDNRNESIQYLSRQSSSTETNQNERGNSMSLNSSNDMTMVNDATELVLTRLGIMRQQQVERPEVSQVTPPREKGNVEYFILIYLHDSYPDESIIKHLRSLVNFLKIFNDSDDCIAFINRISNEKIILILSHSFHKSILPRIEELQQIFTIYILSENENEVALSSRKSKIQGSYTNINDIYEQISNDINKISRDLIIYLNTSSNTTSIQPVIAYFLLLNEIILDKNEKKNNMKELVNFSRQEYEGNDEELKIIDEFENTYQTNQAIYWFSRQCFISKMLNKALRIPEADVLFRFRLFIQDLFQQITDESISDSITVYLGQTIQRSDLNDLQKNILNNDLIIFPQFLFGSTDESRAIRIAKEIPPLNEDLIPLVIRVEISEDIRCANLNSRRYSVDEDNNVLLNMCIMGRLIKVEKDNVKGDKIASIHIRLVKLENQRNIQQILETMRTEIKSFSPFVSMIKLMMQMNLQASCEQIVQTQFDDETLKTDENVQGSIAGSCHILAQSYRNQEDYKRALDLYLLSLHAFHRILSPNAVELSSLNSNIGSMYFRLENYEKSYEYYQKALEIHLHSNTPDLYAVSTFTNSIGIIYSKQKKYPEAIKSFERTLKILQQISEPHDIELSATYDDLADVYLSQLNYDEALNNYKKSIEIQEHIVPQNSQTLGTSHHTMGNIYLKLGRSKEALTHLKHALKYFQESLPLTHPTFALLYNNIGLMYYREEQYSDALECYSKTLEIATISLPENHSLVGITLFNRALVYSSQEKFDEAIESIEKSTAQFLKTLAPDHPDIIENKKYLESIKQKQILKNIFDENTISF